MAVNKLYLFFILLFIGLNSSFSQESTSIFDCIRNNDFQNFTQKIQKNASLVNKKNKNGYTPLILASYYDRTDMVKFLLKKGANLNATSNMGTALMAATYKGATDIVKMLLEHNASVDITDEKGTTALHYACFFNNQEVSKLLLSHRAKTNLKDNKGKTALDYAIANHNIELIKLFKHE